VSSAGGYASRNWYKPRASDLTCSDHPKPSKSLIKAVSTHTHLSELTSAHVLDRLLHLSHCLGEPETMTLYRLQPGKNQQVQPRIPIDE